MSRAQFELSSTSGLTFSDTFGLDNVFNGTISGTIARGSNGRLVTTAEADGTIFGSSLKLRGEIDSSGVFDLKGSATVDLGPLDFSDVSFELDNSGFTFNDDVWDFSIFSGSVGVKIQASGSSFVATVDATGTAFGKSLELDGTINASLNFDLVGYADVTVGPLTLIKARYDLTPKSFAFSDSWDIGPFTGSVATTINSGSSSGFDLFADAKGSIFGEGIELKGDINSSGYYDLTGSAKVSLGPINLDSVSFELSSSEGFTFTHSWDYLVFSGSVTVTMDTQDSAVSVTATGDAFGSNLKLVGYIDAYGKYDLNGQATINVGPMNLANATFDLNNSCFTITDSWDYFHVLSGGVTLTVVGVDQVAVQSSVTILGTAGVRLKGDIGSNSYDLQRKRELPLAA